MFIEYTIECKMRIGSLYSYHIHARICISTKGIACVTQQSSVITLGNKLEMISSKDHQTGVCRLDPLFLVKNVQLLSFLRLF